MEGGAAALVPLVDVLDLPEDGVAHALAHPVQVAVARVRQDPLLVGRGHPERREARLPGRDVAVAAHPDPAAVRRRGDVTILENRLDQLTPFLADLDHSIALTLASCNLQMGFIGAKIDVIFDLLKS